MAKKKLGKRQTAVKACADTSDDISHCFGLENKDEIDYWYNKAHERKEDRY